MRPPSKRINYAAMCQPHPFLPDLDSTEYNFYIVVPVTRGVTTTGSLIYLPTKEDLATKTEAFSLAEKPFKKGADHLDFNLDYAYISGNKINLSKRQLQALSEFKSDEDLEILNRDLSIKTGTPSRECIGFVTRGGFSQLLGHPVGICAVKASVDPGLKFYLFRNSSSLQYHLCRLINFN